MEEVALDEEVLWVYYFHLRYHLPQPALTIARHLIIVGRVSGKMFRLPQLHVLQCSGLNAHFLFVIGHKLLQAELSWISSLPIASGHN